MGAVVTHCPLWGESVVFGHLLCFGVSVYLADMPIKADSWKQGHGLLLCTSHPGLSTSHGVAA